MDKAEVAQVIAVMAGADRVMTYLVEMPEQMRDTGQVAGQQDLQLHGTTSPPTIKAGSEGP